jgi:hypothetical protein
MYKVVWIEQCGLEQDICRDINKGKHKSYSGNYGHRILLGEWYNKFGELSKSNLCMVWNIRPIGLDYSQ